MAREDHSPVGIVIEALARTFHHPAYLALAAAIAALAFVAASWLPNLALVRAVLATPGVSWLTRAQLLASLLAGIGTNFGLIVAVATVTAVLLLGIDVAMIAYFVRSRRAVPGREITAGVGGAVAGAAAAGCAACGSFALFAVLSFLGAAGAITFLPLGGGELSVLSVALVLVSIYLIARRIAVAPACAIRRPSQARGAG
jgi:hypothetical protein